MHLANNLRIIVIISVLSLFYLPSFGQTKIRYLVDEHGNKYIPDQIIVKFKDPDTTIKNIQTFKAVSKTDVKSKSSDSIYDLIDGIETIYHERPEPQKIKRKFLKTSVIEPDELKIHLIKLKEGVLAKDAVKIFKESDEVKYAHLDYILKPFSETDFFLNKTLTRTLPDGSVEVIKALYGLETIGAEKIWKQGYEGQEIIVGVVDSGTDINHSDLWLNIFRNSTEIAGNGIDDDGNGYVDDYQGYDFVNDDIVVEDNIGHGTYVAGIVAGIKDNTIGIVGVGPKVKILPLKFTDDVDGGQLSLVVRAIDYAANLRDPNDPDKSIVDVINISSGVYIPSDFHPELNSLYESIDNARNKGIITIAAVGNDNVSIDNYPVAPASFNNTISVAAINYKNEKYSGSNYGRTVDISAPGENILSIKPRGIALPGGVGVKVGDDGSITFGDNSGEYVIASGTSAAAPFVSGLAALILSKKNDLTIPELIDVLKNSLNTATITSSDRPMPKIIDKIPTFLRNICSTRQTKCGGICRDEDMCCGDGCPICQNSVNRLDVDGNGSVSPLDVLIVINLLNIDSGGFYSCSSAPFYDVTGDGVVTSFDALHVINYINSPQ